MKEISNYVGTPTKKLNNGIEIPVLGLGTWKMADGTEVENAVLWALEAGYRHIDTAKIYGNETGVGKAVMKFGAARSEIFIATKLWNEDQGYKSTLLAINESLSRLRTDYVDLYLIHWPMTNHTSGENRRKETWKAMEEIYKNGKAKAIGVSNYNIKHLQEMKAYAKVPPVVNQVEFHPFLFQKELMDYCNKANIALTAYSPLSHGLKIKDINIHQIAKKHGKTNAQIMLRWSIQHGNVVVPKSATRERILENFSLFDFELTPEEMLSLDALNENYRIVAG